MVERSKIIVSESGLINSFISFKASSTISRFIEPSKLDGVGTDKNIYSELVITSSRLFSDFKGSLS